MASRLLVANRMGLNKPVSAGTLVVVFGAAGYGAYREQQKHSDEQEALAKLDELMHEGPAPSKPPAPPPPKPTHPTFAAFDPSALQAKLQGVWIYGREMFAINGNRLTTYLAGRGEDTSTFDIVAPCLLESHTGTATLGVPFVIETSAQFGAYAIASDGATQVMCDPSTVIIVSDATCQSWKRAAAGWSASDHCEAPAHLGEIPPEVLEVLPHKVASVADGRKELDARAVKHH